MERGLVDGQRDKEMDRQADNEWICRLVNNGWINRSINDQIDR